VRVVVPVLGDTPEAEVAAERGAVAFVHVLLPQLEQFLPQ
jgi:hypothetical protein